MLPIVWDDKARLRLQDVVAYISDHNVAAATRLEIAVYESIGRLASFPYIGRPGRVDGSRELIVHPNYIVVYRITPERIELIDILHARQPYP